MAGDRSQRTEAPTPKRKRDARRKGQVAKTPELVAWAALLAATSLIRATISRASGKVAGLFAHVREVAAHPEPAAMIHTLHAGFSAVLASIIPLVFGLMALGVGVEIAQVGLMPSWKRLKPDPKRLNPAKGLKRLFSVNSAWETAKAAFRVVVLGAVVWPTVSATVRTMTSHGQPLDAIVQTTGDTVFGIVRNAALAGLALAGVDYLVKRRRTLGEIRMTRQEVKDEMRESEGDPHVRQMRRTLQLSMRRSRMLAAIARADAVIVNPTHFAVAISYEAAAGPPRVLARGTDGLAAKIRAEAERHGVPIVADPPLARTLYWCCDLGDAIPAELYEAVAAVLAFVFGLKRRRALPGVHHVPRPVPVTEVNRRVRRPRRRERVAVSSAPAPALR